MARVITAAEFERLYRATAAELFGYVRRRSAVDPEDLVAEIYAIAWRRRAELPSSLLRRAWLFGTARRLLLAETRQRGREHEVVAIACAPGRRERSGCGPPARAGGRGSARPSLSR